LSGILGARQKCQGRSHPLPHTHPIARKGFAAYPTHERAHGGCFGVGVHFSKRVDPGTRSLGIFGGVAGDPTTMREAITILNTRFSFSFSSDTGQTPGLRHGDCVNLNYDLSESVPQLS
jgi:hypothetical protein